MNILLTGGAGFIGSNLCDRLLEEGHKVITLDNFDDFYNPDIKRSNIAEQLKHPNFVLCEGDIRDADLLEAIFAKHKFDLVIHIAARAGVRPSIAEPALYFDVNVNGTITLLEAMRRHGVKKMLFASSSSVYGNSTEVPFSERQAVDNPISPYAASKKAGELICHTYHHLFGFDIFCFRFFTVYGPRQRPEMAIHYFTKNIDEGREIKMFGDGSTRRDYTYVDDITQGLMNAIGRLKGYEIINLGESATISLKDLIGTIENALGKNAIINSQPAQPGDVEVTYADISKAKKLIDYKPTTDVKTGIRKFIDYYLSEKLRAVR